MAAIQVKKQEEMEIGGGHFSRTSTDIQLKAGGAELSALCQTVAGTWVPASLSLHTYLTNHNGTVRVALPDERPGQYEKTCKNLKLVTSELMGEAQREDGRYVPFNLDLDDYVVNDNGKLVVCGGFFSMTSKDITFDLTNGKLGASCKKTDGAWIHSELDLDYLLKNIDGILFYASPPPAGRFMESCDYVKLLGTNLSGRAKCCDGTRKPFHLQLDYNISNQDGKLVWSNPI